MPKAITTGPGKPCPKCRVAMERRKPPAGKPVIYAWWDYCPPCGHVQHYHEALVGKESRGDEPAPKPRKPRVPTGYAIVGELCDPAQDDGSLPW